MASFTARLRQTVDLDGFPDLVVIYLGMQVHTPKGMVTFARLGREIRKSVKAGPDGLLLHENILFAGKAFHTGMRQYWRDFEAMERWTRTLPHQGWWRDFLHDTGGTGFWHETYMRGGAFCKRAMIDFWDQSVGAALRDPRFTFARAVGEMTWALRDIPGAAELVSYESELNRFLPQYPQVILCLYDLERFSGEMVVDIMKTHPKVLVGGAVVENPYYLDPDAFLATMR